jgi:prephenate dehydratase
MRFTFLGPRGTHSEEALRLMGPPDVQAIPCATVHEAIVAVRDGAADRAVVPIENSLEGSVTATLDTLAIDAPQIRILAEETLAIHHSLLARRPLALEEVEEVLSHPQALAQCARYLRARLPRAKQTATASTAEGVRCVAESERPRAAVGARLAGELYGCATLADRVEGAGDNLTRFVLLAREDDPTDQGRAVVGEAEATARSLKTSIVFFGFNDISPGALVAVLGELSSRGINLTKIESRPRRMGLGHYMFFVDLEGGTGTTHVAEALAALAGRVETLHVLGSYPASGAAEDPR